MGMGLLLLKQGAGPSLKNFYIKFQITNHHLQLQTQNSTSLLDTRVYQYTLAADVLTPPVSRITSMLNKFCFEFKILVVLVFSRLYYPFIICLSLFSLLFKEAQNGAKEPPVKGLCRGKGGTHRMDACHRLTKGPCRGNAAQLLALQCRYPIRLLQMLRRHRHLIPRPICLYFATKRS